MDKLWLILLLASAVQARVELHCECAIAVKEPLVWTNVFPELADPAVEIISSCDNVDASCKADCETSHNYWWNLNSLWNVNPETNQTYGTDMCKRFDRVIDPATAGYPLVTIFNGQEYWLETSLFGRQNLCCAFIDGSYVYQQCAL